MSTDKARIQNFIQEKLIALNSGVSVTLTNETDLFEAGYVDSLSFMDLLIAVEEEFGIEISFQDNDPKRFGVFGSFVQSIADLQANK